MKGSRMTDPRITNMADILTHYSARVKKGDLVAIRGGTSASSLILQIYENCLKVGAFPYTLVSLPGMDEIFYKHANRDQLSFLSPISKLEIEKVDVFVSILSETNTRRLSSVDPEKQALTSKARQSIMKTFMKRAAAYEKGDKNGLRWTLTLFPTEAYAQDAEMGIAEYEDFVFGACYADKKNGIQKWKEVEKSQQRVIRYLKGRKKVEIFGPGTDLKVGISGRKFINCSGHNNFPDGEVFTGPEENSVEGKIRYSFPACLSGREVDGVELEFKKGEVVKASAEKNEKFLLSMIGMDAGSKRIGEFAFGLNYGIKQYTKNILFDEKMGGTVHLALGKGYPESGSRNNSALHWDMVCDLRKDGEVYVDGKLFFKKGKLQI